MLYILVTRDKTGKVTGAIEVTKATKMSESRWYWKSFDEVKAIADALGSDYIPVDNGECVSPRFEIIKSPKIGDKVSRTINGDYYPCGEIVSISDSKRVVTTSSGHRFYRRGQTGKWMFSQCWSLVSGHHDRLNPEF
jgi:hypothetical protein